jgi:hypothetical protein
MSLAEPLACTPEQTAASLAQDTLGPQALAQDPLGPLAHAQDPLGPLALASDPPDPETSDAGSGPSGSGPASFDRRQLLTLWACRWCASPASSGMSTKSSRDSI